MALITFLVAMDSFIVVVPNEVLLIPVVLARPKRWILSAMIVALGSAAGATGFAWIVRVYGDPFLAHYFPHLLQSPIWLKSIPLIQEYSAWGLALIALSPIPQQAAVAISGLANIHVSIIFFSIFIGRAVKFLFVASCAIYAPQILNKLHSSWKLKKVQDRL